MTLVDAGADSYRERMSVLFATFDRDGDGRVGAADFEARAERVLAEVGLHPRSPKGRAVVRGAQRYFGAIASIADEDGDGIVGRAEFVAAAEQRLRHNPDGFEAMIHPWIAALLDVAGADGEDGEEGDNGGADDGAPGALERAVDCARWIRMLRAAGVEPAEAADVAARIDPDGDGRIGAGQVLDAARAFYTDLDPGDRSDVRVLIGMEWQDLI